MTVEARRVTAAAAARSGSGIVIRASRATRPRAGVVGACPMRAQHHRPVKALDVCKNIFLKGLVVSEKFSHRFKKHIVAKKYSARSNSPRGAAFGVKLQT